MVRPLLLSAGSRGDLEPLLALANSPDLDSPVLFIQRDYHWLAPKAHVLPFSTMQMAPSFQYAASKAESDKYPFDTMWRAVAHSAANNILPTIGAILTVAQKSNIDVVVSTAMTWIAGYVVAEKLNVPLVFLTFQPGLRSRFVPHPCMLPEKAAVAFEMLLNGETPHGDDENVLSYSRLHDIGLPEFLDPLNEHLTRLGLAPIDEKRASQIVDGRSEVPCIVACSRRLSPAPSDWGSCNFLVGSLASSFKPPTYNPEKDHPELCRYLESGPPPVVVSYGSAGAVLDCAKLMRTVLTGLRDADIQRVVILPGSSRLNLSLLDQDSELAVWAHKTVMVVEQSVQYSYLLPKASVMLTHGGAGSVTAALHSGTPVVITPVFADQPFYAELITRLRLGTATPIGLDTLESENITSAVQAALSQQVVENVRKFAYREQNDGSPVKLAATALAKIVEHSKTKVV